MSDAGTDITRSRKLDEAERKVKEGLNTIKSSRIWLHYKGYSEATLEEIRDDIDNFLRENF